jgi:hypothetical protein
MFINHSDILMSKIIFKNLKIYYFNIFMKKKHFKKQLLHISKYPWVYLFLVQNVLLRIFFKLFLDCFDVWY